MENDDVNKVLYMIQKGQLELDVCDVLGASDTLKIFKHLTKTSRSASEVAFASVILPGLSSARKRTRGNDASNLAVSMKIWLNWNELSDTDIDDLEDSHPGLGFNTITGEEAQGLFYETEVYRFITAMFIDSKLSNNFIPYLGFAQCTIDGVLDAARKTPENKTLVTYLQKFSLVPNAQLNFLLTGTLHDLNNIKPLYVVIRSMRKDELPAMRNIVVQILYALFLMQQIKLIHNDFHTGNILVELLPYEQEVEIKEIGLRFKTKYIPKIFDWDLSYCPSLGPNPKISDGYGNMNLRNRFRKNSDYYQLMCGLYSERWQDVIEGFVPDSSFQYWKANTTIPKISLNISQNQSEMFQNFILQNLLEPDVTGIIPINIPKHHFESIMGDFDPNAVFHDKGQIERYNKTHDVFLFFNPNALQPEITFTSQYACYPLNDPSDELVYPLEKLFDPSTEIFRNMAALLPQ